MKGVNYKIGALTQDIKIVQVQVQVREKEAEKGSKKTVIN